VLGHLDGEQWIAHEVLNRLFLLAGQAQERSVVAGPEEHEATRPTIASISPWLSPHLPCGERLVYLRVEMPQLLFKGFGNLVKSLVGNHLNVIDYDARDIHRLTSLGRQTRFVVANDAARARTDSVTATIISLALIFISPCIVSDSKILGYTLSPVEPTSA